MIEFHPVTNNKGIVPNFRMIGKERKQNGKMRFLWEIHNFWSQSELFTKIHQQDI